MNLEELSRMLVDSHWPACNQLAKQIGEVGGPAASQALQSVLSEAKRHHIRTACIRELALIGDVSDASVIRKYLADSAYETRMAAKEAVLALTGEAVLTSRGE